MVLKFFGPNHRHKEVDEEKERDDGDDDDFHEVLLKPVAKTHIQSAHDEKQHDSSDEKQVAHCPISFSGV
jgi:hypothetical protein